MTLYLYLVVVRCMLDDMPYRLCNAKAEAQQPSSTRSTPARLCDSFGTKARPRRVFFASQRSNSMSAAPATVPATERPEAHTWTDGGGLQGYLAKGGAA